MARKLKLLTGLSTIALAGAALTACGGGEGETQTAAAPDDHAGHRMATAEGEGEGGVGEGEGAGAADAVTDAPAYLSQLMLIRGHLKAGATLYAIGDAEMAVMHMKHPEDELYAGLRPALDARGAQGFEAELRALAASVEGGASLEQVETDLAAVHAAIDAAADAASPTSKEVMLAAAQTLRVAGEEFDIGVVDGEIVNVHEYQDAYGFMTTVIDYLARVRAPDGATDAALGEAREQAALALEVAPGVVPPETVTTKSSTIYGAAARIEIAALGVE